MEEDHQSEGVKAWVRTALSEAGEGVRWHGNRRDAAWVLLPVHPYYGEARDKSWGARHTVGSSRCG